MILALKSKLANIETLQFSPDGGALIASSETQHVVWPDWSATIPKSKSMMTESRPHRSAVNSDGSGLFMSLLVGQKTSTRVLNLATGSTEPCGISLNGASWFHFDTRGGYAIVSHGRDRLTRFDYAPGAKKPEKRWSIERGGVYSHYRFGAICAGSGSFIAIEVQSRAGDPLDGLVVRSVADGAIIWRAELSDADAQLLLNTAPKFAFHPSGTQMAVSSFPELTFRSLGDSSASLTVPCPLETDGFQGIAYHPTRQWLAVTDYSDTVTLYSTKMSRAEHTFQAKNHGKDKIRHLHAVSFTPDGKFLAAAGGKGIVALWEVNL